MTQQQHRCFELPPGEPRPRPKPEYTFIVAKTRQMAELLADAKGKTPGEWVYVNRAANMRGYRDVDVWIYGPLLHERRDWRELVDIINHRERLGDFRVSTFGEEALCEDGRCGR